MPLSHAVAPWDSNTLLPWTSQRRHTVTDSIQAKTILVVEDESIIAMDIQNSLRHLGYQTPVAVHNAREAIEAAGRLKPDLVLMDIFLQGKWTASRPR